jgi:hypothetical protein
MSIRVECDRIKDADDSYVLLFQIIDDEREDGYRNMSFVATIEEAEEIANQLLQAVFERTEPYRSKNKNEITEENKHQEMWKYIWKCLGHGEPKNSDFWRFCERLTFNRFEPYNGDMHLVSNGMNTNVIGNVIECMFDVLKGYDTGYRPVMKIIIHDNVHGKEYHFKFNGEKQVFDL